MLCLQRFVKEQVIIIVPPSDSEQRVEVKLCQVMGPQKARLGFTAPPLVTIHREEIQLEIDRAAVAK